MIFCIKENLYTSKKKGFCNFIATNLFMHCCSSITTCSFRHQFEIMHVKEIVMALKKKTIPIPETVMSNS